MQEEKMTLLISILLLPGENPSQYIRMHIQSRQTKIKGTETLKYQQEQKSRSYKTHYIILGPHYYIDQVSYYCAILIPCYNINWYPDTQTTKKPVEIIKLAGGEVLKYSDTS